MYTSPYTHNLLKEEVEKQHSVATLKIEAQKIQLESEKSELAEQLIQTTMLLSTQKEGWDREREKTLSLTFSELRMEGYWESSVIELGIGRYFDKDRLQGFP